MSTIKQKEVVVETIDGKKVTVRRMRWGAAALFLKKFAAAIAVLYGDGGFGQAAAAKSLPEAVDMLPNLLPKIGDIVMQSEDLANHLAVSTTDLSPDDFAALDLPSAFDVLTASITLNFDAELKKSLAGIGAAAKALIPAPAKTN